MEFICPRLSNDTAGYLTFCRPLLTGWIPKIDNKISNLTFEAHVKCSLLFIPCCLSRDFPLEILSFNFRLSNDLVSNGVSRTLGVPNKIFGVRNAILKSESLYVLVGCTFFNRAEVYERLQVLLLKETLSSLIIPA